FMQGLSAGETLQIFGDGRQTRDFVNVADVAQANVVALASDYTGVCNVATGSRIELLELVEILGGCVGEPASLEFKPPRSGDIRHSCGSGKRLRQRLGFAPAHKLEQGLEQLTAYVREHGGAEEAPQAVRVGGGTLAASARAASR
ncbi:MAG TPA: GDP-mannose 4,6-dehydratase, partial [Nevskia sp.]|nr:GDP-mannose 4,6-dehydratase [Nevskia sp.]